MKLPLIWLHDYCRPDVSASELASRLALTGTEVDRILHHGVSEADCFIVGRVLSAERHPDADRLSVCIVATGEGDTAQIVCGAPNVAAGQTVAVAQPGAVMPDGTKLGKAKLRGVESSGMILAEDELAIGSDHAGIMILDEDLVPGTPLAEVLPISTDVLELEITPNRPDCLSVYGVAREVHAATDAPLTAPPWQEDSGSAGRVPGFDARVEAGDLCPRFTLRLFEDVKIGPSPPWLKARLSAAGQRPISNVVDITNYVMLLTGQPMHAFDADTVAGGILTVRRAREGETLTTLDGVQRPLDPDVCLIEDAAGPTSIAGVMGGARSEVSESTTRVLMEAATWNGPNIQRTSTRLGLRTEASGRFEKQLSPEAAMEAQAIATKLMVELCGARVVEGTIDVLEPVGSAPFDEIELADRTVERILGVAIPREECAAILTRLGFETRDAGEGLNVRVPHWRRDDVAREADLVEEVARIWGLDRLPVTLPSRRDAVGRLDVAQQLRRRAEDVLTGCGLSEAIGWSFAAPSFPQRLGLADSDPRSRFVTLANPMSEDQSVLRTTLLVSLLDNVRTNRARGNHDVKLFECGTVYVRREATDAAAHSGPGASERDAAVAPSAQRDAVLPVESTHVAALLTGSLRPVSWREPQPPQADYFAVKGVLAALLDALRVPWEVQAASEPFLHPGRSARILIGGLDAGWLGELHPTIVGGWDIASAAGFELDWATVAQAAVHVPHYRDVTSFPAVRQDLAVVVSDDVTAEEVLDQLRSAGGKLLRKAEVFDVYRGEQVGEGRASLAIRLEFGADDRTLTDEEVGVRRAKIVSTLAERLGGELRG